MSNINEALLRETIRQELFNNQIKEMFQVDKVENMKYSKDTPGPNISGDQQYENTFELEEDIPILPYELMTDQNLLRVYHDVMSNEYKALNKKELRSATLSAIDMFEDLEDKNNIEKVWNNFTNLLSKVCNQ